MKRYGLLSIAFIALLGFTLFLQACKKKDNPAAPSSNPTPTYTPSTSVPYFSKGVSFGSGTMGMPYGVAITGSDLWVVNENTNLQEWPLSGDAPLTTITSFSSPATSLNTEYGVGIGQDGYIYVPMGLPPEQVVELSPTGTYVSGFGNAKLSGFPIGVAISSSIAYVLDQSGGQILAYTIGGSGASKTFTYVATMGTTGAGTLGASPMGICIDSLNNVYVSDSANKRIMKYNSNGVYQSAITLTSLGVPTGVNVDAFGYIYASDTRNHEVQMFNSSGNPVTQFGASYLTTPAGIAIDLPGNIWVADSTANQVVEFSRH